jgi:FtsZ-binding cell division protein ZapB
MLSETSKTIVGIIIDQLEKGDKKGRKEYGISIDNAEDIKYNWNLEAMQEMADALKYQQKEIEFLKQRNKDLRQKTWYPVYEENLLLKQENNKLKVAIVSVQEFTKQFT